MIPMKTKIKAKYIIAYHHNDHSILRDAELVYEADTIVFVGFDYPFPVDHVIDAGNAILSPGFIDLNALGDIDHELVHNEHPNPKNLLWSQAYYQAGPREFLTPEEEAFKSLYAYTQLIRNGITTAMPITSVFYKQWAETYEELEAAAHHAGRLGLRMYMGPSYQSSIRVVKPDLSVETVWREDLGEAGLERAVKFIKNFDGAYDGLIRGMLAPERIENQTPELLQKARRYSDEFECPIRLHAAQGSYEFFEIQRLHQKTPIQYLHDLGFLGPRVSIPHMIYIDSYKKTGLGKQTRDLEIIRETQTTAIHCPFVIAMHSEFMETFSRYKRAGVQLALGTDTFPPDIIMNIRMGSYISRILEGTWEDCTFADYYRAATLGGARALNREDLGRLAPGAKADMIVIDMSGFHIGPQDDPIRTLMVSGSGLDIRTSIINGKVVMQDRQIPGIDLETLQAQGQAYYEKLRQSYVERATSKLPEEEFFPPSFPTFASGSAKDFDNTFSAQPPFEKKS